MKQEAKKEKTFAEQLAELQKELEAEALKDQKVQEQIDAIKKENPNFFEGKDEELDDEIDKVRKELTL